MPVAYERPETDFYRTPRWVMDRFLAAWKVDAPKTILEPCAGDGALLAPLREHWPDATIDAYDLESRHPAVVNRSMWMDDTPQRYDLVVTNPPYNIAEQIVHYGLSKLAPGGHLALLLRLDFLGSAERRPLWRRSMPASIYTLSDRPSFKGKGTDSVYSAWFVWAEGKRRRHYRGYVL